MQGFGASQACHLCMHAINIVKSSPYGYENNCGRCQGWEQNSQHGQVRLHAMALMFACGLLWVAHVWWRGYGYGRWGSGGVEVQ